MEHEQDSASASEQSSNRLLTFFRRVPCQLLCVFTLACLLVGEQYPFSNFPMYSSFGGNTYYVYLADGTGNPLPTLSTTGMTTAMLKKLYDGELRKEIARLRNTRRRLTVEQKRPVGERVLFSLRSSLWAQQRGGDFPRELRLYEVNISLSGTRFEKQSDLIAEML